VRTIYAVRISGLFLSWVVPDCSLRGFLVRTSSTCFRVTNSSARGLFGRSCLCATVPQPVPSWTPADRELRPRSGAIRPTPIKSVRSSCGTPRRSIIGNTPGPRTRSRGRIELAWSRRDSRAKAANQHRHKSRSVFSHAVIFNGTLDAPGRRTGQRWEPTRAPRQGLKRNEGGPAGPPFSFAPSLHSSLSFMR